MKNFSYILYVDESGDEGFKFSSGSSEWFILSGVLTRYINDLEVVKLIDDVKAELNKPPKMPLHFRKLKHEQRLPLIDKIAKARLRTVSILIHKPSLREPEKFRERYRLYFYSVRYLLERVSWLCRDTKLNDDRGDGSVSIIFSNRSGMSYEELCEYLDLLKYKSQVSDVQIDWDAINTEQITSYSPGKRMGLQIADAIASSFGNAVNKSQYGFIEDRYVNMLRPVVYKRKNQYLGYGIKFWPIKVDEVLSINNKLTWINLYK